MLAFSFFSSFPMVCPYQNPTIGTKIFFITKMKQTGVSFQTFLSKIAGCLSLQRSLTTSKSNETRDGGPYQPKQARESLQYTGNTNSIGSWYNLAPASRSIKCVLCSNYCSAFSETRKWLLLLDYACWAIVAESQR